MKKLDITKIFDVEIDGINMSDYPDFVDAYISAAVYPVVKNPRSGYPEDWRDLTEEELEYLNEKEQDFKYKQIYKYIY